MKNANPKRLDLMVRGGEEDYRGYKDILAYINAHPKIRFLKLADLSERDSQLYEDLLKSGLIDRLTSEKMGAELLSEENVNAVIKIISAQQILDHHDFLYFR